MLGNISKREKLLAALTAGVAAIAFTYAFIVEPLINRWKDLDGNIRDKEVLLVKHSKIIRNKKEIESEHKEYEKYYRR